VIAGPSIQGQVQNGVLTFNPANATGADQRVLNIFYYCCFMHDFFYLLGFREADGNFQDDNFGRGGLWGDRVDAQSHPEQIDVIASMATGVDGHSPIMKMGLYAPTNRHSAFDSTIVFHEFTHGVTSRLVGGPQNAGALADPQSAGMSEGWSDYIACIINNTTVVGAWLLNNTGGLRGFPYDSNFPDNFGDLGTGRYAADPASGQPNDPHNVGEIWCATLMEMTRNIGKNLAVQLVVDALKLSTPNPGFLGMRVSIFRALDDMRLAGVISTSEHYLLWRDIWRAFAKFGMGPRATSYGVFAQLTGNVADFEVPPEEEQDIAGALSLLLIEEQEDIAAARMLLLG
jgi:extracellular elastinolytic metalloproteinase